jgi:hypothetical protein
MLPAFVDKINQHNGRLIDIKSAVSLESVFFKILQEKQARH